MRPCLAHFFQTIRTPFSREKPGVNPSTFGPLNSNPGAAPAWEFNQRGLYSTVIFHCCGPVSFSPACGYGVVARVPGVDPEGGESGGSDPPFSGLVRPWTPLRYSIAGVKGRPPQGGRSRHSDPCRKARIPEA